MLGVDPIDRAVTEISRHTRDRCLVSMLEDTGSRECIGCACRLIIARVSVPVTPSRCRHSFGHDITHSTAPTDFRHRDQTVSASRRHSAVSDTPCTLRCRDTHPADDTLCQTRHIHPPQTDTSRSHHSATRDRHTQPRPRHQTRDHHRQIRPRHLIPLPSPFQTDAHATSLGPHRSLTTPLLPDFLPHPPPEQRPQHESAQMP